MSVYGGCMARAWKCMEALRGYATRQDPSVPAVRTPPCRGACVPSETRRPARTLPACPYCRRPAPCPCAAPLRRWRRPAAAARALHQGATAAPLRRSEAHGRAMPLWRCWWPLQALLSPACSESAVLQGSSQLWPAQSSDSKSADGLRTGHLSRYATPPEPSQALLATRCWTRNPGHKQLQRRANTTPEGPERPGSSSAMG